MTKLAVILSGTGVYDGSEINEAVLTLLSIEESGSTYQCFAPDMEQMHVVNHLTGEVMVNESRNVLVESARITRGDVKPITELNAIDFDGLIVVGGFGAAKNLSDFAIKGAEFSAINEFIKVATDFKNAQKVVGYMCIAPMLLTAVYDDITLTIGNDADTAKTLEGLGAKHEVKDVTSVSIDIENRVVTTPAYMLANSLLEARVGIKNLVDSVVSLSQ
ncbi:isoprenoid biosynthesis glyoxalase ElbB [Moritella sp. 36]|uniref:isoprenoid biosynthesis glyoxalase ElbB n=1 Tax=Moritella sp. 36 TaxID=2746233 RepID=UPI001BAA2AFB|nr:isoprenoid biosynthesis glyoxalase ElbB [Moritella sp. 36]QUM90485.1 isoprenoid biosynthesis glyoxalase ElbB [Moritella sp. 36]